MKERSESQIDALVDRLRKASKEFREGIGRGAKEKFILFSLSVAAKREEREKRQRRIEDEN